MTIEKEKQENKILRAVFLDRDGIINRAIIRDGKPYPPWNLNEFKFVPNVKKICKKLKELDYILVIATNQPDVGRGSLSQKIVEKIHASILKYLPIDRIEVCYHPGRERSYCECRKPLPGMLLHASQELGIDLSKSWMIGDRLSDIECGHSAGCKTILIGNGYGEILKTAPDFRVQKLSEIVTIIMKRSIL